MKSRHLNTSYARLAAAWSDRNQLGWIGVGQVDVAYLGWVNRGNLGDQSMFDLQTSYAGDLRVRSIPLDRLTRKVALVRRPDIGTVLVGGGTLIGRDGWAAKVADVRVRARVGRIAVLGAGVEDPEFGGSRGITTAEGIGRWTEILRGAAFVGVRGPQSQQHLEAWGVDSVVVGDPALTIPIRMSEGKARDLGSPVVAVNLAAVADGYAMGVSKHYSQLMKSLCLLTASGARIRFFAMEPRDAVMMNEVVPEMLRPALSDMPTSLGGLYELLRSSAVVISRAIARSHHCRKSRYTVGAHRIQAEMLRLRRVDWGQRDGCNGCRRGKWRV